MRPTTLALIASTCLSVTPGAVQARSQESLRYRYEHIWNAAVRLIRVEMGLEIPERDPDAGFFLFNYVDHDKAYPGSFELVRQREGSRDLAAVVVHVGGMPRYIERMILDKLSKKLEHEYGPPLAPTPKPAPKPEPEPPSDEPDGEHHDGEDAPKQ